MQMQKIEARGYGSRMNDLGAVASSFSKIRYYQVQPKKTFSGGISSDFACGAKEDINIPTKLSNNCS